MSKKPQDEITRPLDKIVMQQCTYCFSFTKDLWEVHLRFDGNHFESQSNNICNKCRDYLQGQFKYA